MGARKGNLNAAGNLGRRSSTGEQLKPYHFKPGNKFGGDHKSGLKSRDHLLRIVLSMMTPEEWDEWFNKMKEEYPKTMLQVVGRIIHTESKTTIEGHVSFTDCLKVLEARAKGEPPPALGGDHGESEISADDNDDGENGVSDVQP